MNAISSLDFLLHSLENEETYLFTQEDMRSAFAGLVEGAYRSLLKRAEDAGILQRATPAQALRDMRRAGRNLDLIDWETSALLAQLPAK